MTTPITRAWAWFVRTFLITRENDFVVPGVYHLVVPSVQTSGKTPPIATQQIELPMYLQYVRIFLIPGIRPRASILLLAYARFILLTLVISGVAGDVLFLDGHLKLHSGFPAWIARPTNWTSLLVIVYLSLCVYAAWRAPQYGISDFDPAPAPWYYVAIFHLTNLLMPICICTLLAYLTVFHTLSASYLVALITAFVEFVFVELYYGAHRATIKLITTPLLAGLGFQVYVLLAQAVSGTAMYQSFDWLRAPVDALLAALRMFLAITAVGGFCYFAMSARAEYMGTRAYRFDPADIAKLKEKAPQVLMPVAKKSRQRT